MHMSGVGLGCSFFVGAAAVACVAANASLGAAHRMMLQRRRSVVGDRLTVRMLYPLAACELSSALTLSLEWVNDKNYC